MNNSTSPGAVTTAEQNISGTSHAVDWIKALPKVELHVHLEGAISPDVLWTRLERHGGDPSVPDLAALRDRFRFHDFQQFISTWVWKSRYLRDAEDYACIGEAFAHRCVEQQIIYCEAHLSPIDASAHGLSIGETIRAVRRGLDRVPEANVALIIDLVRDYGPEQALQTLDALEEVRDQGVVGIGLGGSENHHPPELFTTAFRLAADRGWHRTVHAGEAAGPDSIRAAVLNLGAERIGHGIRAIEDPSLMHLLDARGITLEVCPTSNLRTGVVERLDHHPIAALRAAGLRVTANSDDPAMFGSELSDELRLLHDRLGWSPAALRAMQHVAIDAAFVSEDMRAQLHRLCPSI